MCGFLTMLAGRPGSRRDRFGAAVATLEHRGPDATNIWWSANERMALGHTRLSIIGLDNGDQPIGTADERVQVVVNGELYGYQSQRSELRADGVGFATDSDSEIALQLYLRHGAGMVRQLRGEFAIVVADQRSAAQYAFRDRFGIKPLFYAVHDGDVIFASEIKALLALGVPARWDATAYLSEMYLVRPHQRTLFAGIHTVPPGHYAIAQDGEVTLHPYWDTDYATAEELAADDRSDQEAAAQFREVLSDAMRERLVADVEVASYLSGGIDSCAVLGLAQQMNDRPIRAFTITFDDEMYDESLQAERQAGHVGANYTPVPVSTADLADNYADAVGHAETLFVNGHGVAKYLLSRAVRDAGIKVVFTGEGADEMLGGYPPFRQDVLAGIEDPAEREAALARMVESNPTVRGLLTADAEPPPLLDGVLDRLGWVPAWMTAFTTPGNATRSLFRPQFAASLADLDPYRVSLDHLPIEDAVQGRARLDQALYLWNRTQLPNFILTFLSDRMEMAHSVEGRVPFLDHHVAEFCARLPSHLKIRDMREKHILREAVTDCVIPEVLDREKQPFAAPPARSAHDPMHELAMDVLTGPAIDHQPIFDPQAVRAFLDRLDGLDHADRTGADFVVHRLLSTTILHERFAMSPDVA
ncbi:MAG: asparagine synthase (glutamine-hydrolyzing) [Actinomycetota bacterium]|nr:asparagine synthase (glutamine-hydrolyzing) [Actinomycetota bacterium]